MSRTSNHEYLSSFKCIVLSFGIFLALLRSQVCSMPKNFIEKQDRCYDSAQVNQYSDMISRNWPSDWECPLNCICYATNITVESTAIVNCSAKLTKRHSFRNGKGNVLHHLFENTTYLDLAGKALYLRLSPTSFDYVTNLVYLNLADSIMFRIGSSWFAQLHRLKALCLPNNRILTIDGKAFSGLQQLEILDLSHNMLARLADFVFSPLISLKYLDLSANELSSFFNHRAFNDTTESMTLLNVSYNRLLSTPLSFSAFDSHTFLRNLKYFSCSGNPATLDSSKYYLSHLEILELDRALVYATYATPPHLSQAPFEKYPELRKLVLRHAFIIVGKSAVIRNCVQLSRCAPKGPFETETSEIDIEQFLSHTLCNFCGWLVDFQKQFSSCFNMLEEVCNSDNSDNSDYLDDPENSDNSEALDDLGDSDYSNNSDNSGSAADSGYLTTTVASREINDYFKLVNFSSLSVFQNLNHLEELDLSDTKGVVLHDKTFENSIHIMRLILNNFEIDTQFYDTQVLHKLVNLKVFHLSHNNIESVNFSFLPSFLWKKLVEIDLSYNPFSCECDIAWLLHWISTTNATVLNLKQPLAYTCASPRSMKDWNILDVNVDHCNAAPPDKILKIIWVILFIFVLSSMISALIHKFRWHVRYWKFKVQSQLRQYGETIDEGEYRYDAFVIYSSDDSHWISQQLLPQLENSTEEDLSLCIHERDWLGGALICENITESIESSRKCLLIVSNAFAKSNWCNYEMTLLQSRSITEDFANTVLVCLEEIAPVNLTPRLRLQMQHQTYIEWTEDEIGQTLFWSRLRKALKKPKQSIVNAIPPRNEFLLLH